MAVKDRRQLLQNKEIVRLDGFFPDWRAIVGAVDIKKEDPPADNAYRQWLATKDRGYRLDIETSDSAVEIAWSIREFLLETEAAARVAA